VYFLPLIEFTFFILITIIKQNLIEENMRVVFIEPSGAGGIAHCTYALAKALGAQDVQCDIITGVRWDNRELPDNVRVHRVFRGKRTNPLRLWSICRRLSNKADIVHWQCATYPRLMLNLMRLIPLKRIPWIYTVHNVLPHEADDSSVALYRNIYQRIQGLIFHTNHSRIAFNNLFQEIKAPSEIIPLGEYGFLLNNADATNNTDHPVILFFGNIRPYKGLDVLLRSFVNIKQRVPTARLKIVGQVISSFEPYQKIIDESGIAESVDIHLGYMPDVELSEVLNQSTVAVLPYRDIDQSAVLMLMMAAGKAIVASKVGGIDEVISHNQTGLLVSPGDVQELADAVVSLISDPSKVQELEQNVKLDAQTRFSWETIAKETMTFYKTVSRV
jgi:glycosyltransferase involved in cell wall biosynthesis